MSADQGAHNSGMITSMQNHSAAGHSGGGGPVSMGANNPAMTDFAEGAQGIGGMQAGVFSGSILGAKTMDETGATLSQYASAKMQHNLGAEVRMRQAEAQVGKMPSPDGVGMGASLGGGGRGH